jgi:hypothetical protein
MIRFGKSRVTVITLFPGQSATLANSDQEHKQFAQCTARITYTKTPCSGLMRVDCQAARSALMDYRSKSESPQHWEKIRKWSSALWFRWRTGFLDQLRHARQSSPRRCHRSQNPLRSVLATRSEKTGTGLYKETQKKQAFSYL